MSLLSCQSEGFVSSLLARGHSYCQCSALAVSGCCSLSLVSFDGAQGSDTRQ